MVGGGVGQQLEVVGSVLVVRGYIESHQPVEELLTGLVVGEESVPVDMVARMGGGQRVKEDVRFKLSRKGWSVKKLDYVSLSREQPTTSGVQPIVEVGTKQK